MNLFNEKIKFLILLSSFSINVFAGSVNQSSSKQKNKKNSVASSSSTSKAVADQSVLSQMENDYKNALNGAVAPNINDSIPFAGGILTRSAKNQFKYISTNSDGTNHETYLNLNDNLATVARENPGIRDAWIAQYGVDLGAGNKVANTPAVSSNSDIIGKGDDNINFIKETKDSSVNMLITASAKYKNGEITKDQYVQIALQVSQTADYYNKVNVPNSPAAVGTKNVSAPAVFNLATGTKAASPAQTPTADKPAANVTKNLLGKTSYGGNIYELVSDPPQSPSSGKKLLIESSSGRTYEQDWYADFSPGFDAKVAEVIDRWKNQSNVIELEKKYPGYIASNLAANMMQDYWRSQARTEIYAEGPGAFLLKQGFNGFTDTSGKTMGLPDIKSFGKPPFSDTVDPAIIKDFQTNRANYYSESGNYLLSCQDFLHDYNWQGFNDTIRNPENMAWTGDFTGTDFPSGGNGAAIISFTIIKNKTTGVITNLGRDRGSFSQIGMKCTPKK
jgi:hypothetical protein